MKRALILIAIAAMTALSAAAQPGPPPPPRGDVLADYLQLTAAQKSAWQSARTAFETAVKPLHDQQRATHEQIEQALSGPSPDAAAIGKLVIAAHALGDQIKAAHDTLETTLQSVLTPEQKTKYDAFEAAQKFLQQHGPRPGGPGGPR
jgi:Spy/CpxP family protein refolding chaperone